MGGYSGINRGSYLPLLLLLLSKCGHVESLFVVVRERARATRVLFREVVVCCWNLAHET